MNDFAAAVAVGCVSRIVQPIVVAAEFVAGDEGSEGVVVGEDEEDVGAWLGGVGEEPEGERKESEGELSRERGGRGVER